jgi:hypothetical protein
VSDIPGLIRSLRGETDYPDGLVLQRVAEELEWHVYALANARAEIEELKERLARTAAPEATRSVWQSLRLRCLVRIGARRLVVDTPYEVTEQEKQIGPVAENRLESARYY